MRSQLLAKVSQPFYNVKQHLLRASLLIAVLCIALSQSWAIDLSAVVLTTTPSNISLFGKPVTLTATATGGTTLQYKFMYGLLTLRDFNSNNSFTWTPAAVKEYTPLTVVVKDTSAVNPNVTVTSTNVSLTIKAALSAVALTTSPLTSTLLGNPVTLTASTTGGASLLYKFMNGTEVIRDFDSSNSVVWTPTIAQSYDLIAVAKDLQAVDPTATISSPLKSYIISQPLSAVSIAATPTDTILFGKSVTLTATKTGGANVQYKFMYGALVLRDFASSNIYVWTPGSVKTYTSVAVIAKDLGGTNPNATVTSSSITVNTKAALSEAILTITPLATAMFGTQLNLAGSTTGGVNIQYKFMYGAIVLRDFNSSNTLLWTPGAVKTYDNLTVIAKDLSGDNPALTYTSLPKSMIITKPNMPTITSFTPTSYPVGNKITITGTNLYGTTAVKFNGKVAITIKNISATSVEATVPVGATTGKISLTTPGGTVTSIGDFTVVPTPTISSFTPSVCMEGEVVTITGTNLLGTTDVKFTGTVNSITAKIINNTTDTLTVLVPVGAISGKITISTAGGSFTSANSITIYFMPTISSFTPITGKVGTEVTITGTNFSNASVVKFNNVVSASVTYISTTSLKAIVPENATTGRISITTNGTTFSSTDFTVLPKPTITSFSPVYSLQPTTGATVIITGTNLTGITDVKFNGKSVTTILDNTITSLKVILPVDVTTGKITLTNEIGSATSANYFSVITNGTPGINPTDGADMVKVTKGTFTMGSPDGIGGPSHPVTITSDYWIYKNEVTVAQYIAFCEATGRALPAFPQSEERFIFGSDGNRISLLTNYSWEDSYNWYNPTLQKQPIVNVTWDDCKAYATWANATLPTEAQWEYAARGTQGFNYPWMGTVTLTDLLNGWDETKSANYYNSYNLYNGVNNFNISTKPVGSFPAGASWCGAQDMSGNAWEWCADWYASYTADPATDPTGPLTGTYHVKRGGSWRSDSYNSRTSTRGYDAIHTNEDGFRCVVTGDISKPLPVISSFTPGNGTIGTAVTITGKYFTGTTVVKFNGVTSALFTVNSPTSITAVVPVGVTANGKISVTTANGTAISVNDFSLPPAITSFLPISGTTGTIVVITGNSLTGITGVQFNGVAATFNIISATTINAAVPAGTLTGKITITNAVDTATSTNNFYLPPTISSFTPVTGLTGTAVTITGTNFTDATAVKFNTTSATFNVVNATTITTTVPVGATIGKISVTTPGGTVTSTADFSPAPVITSFAPTFGSASTPVTITGINFTGITALKFNGISATIIGTTATTITTTVPAGATTGKITVTNVRGTATSTNDFCIPATISSFTPVKGAVDTVVTITGTNFIGATSVKFNAKTALFTVVNATTITATVPADATTGKITVTTPAGTVTSVADFCPAPVITSFTPIKGVLGTAVTITGLNFTGTKTVTFNGVSSLFTVNSATTLTTAVPVGASTGKIYLTTANGAATSTNDFYLPPTITSFTPTTGATGAVVTISGKNLTGTTEVKFNGVTTLFAINGITSITAMVPANATTGKISLTTPGGSATSSTDFIIDLLVGTPSTNLKDNAAMVWVPGGTFTMGTAFGNWWTPATQQVTLSGYWIYKNEVTVAQYRAFCAALSHPLPTFPTGYFSWAGKADWTDARLQAHPIINVTWSDCAAYANWAGVELPTEAQWEYAATGPQNLNLPWGGVATLADQLNGWDKTKCANTYNSEKALDQFNTPISTWPVGSFPQGDSWCGAQDMAGNVWEWCDDLYGDYAPIPVTNPTGSVSGINRVIRGGSWKSSGSSIVYRATYRYNNDPANSNYTLGFRCAKSVPGQ